MLAYSPKAAASIALLKRGYNEISVFVEDTASYSMWNTIVKEAVREKIKFTSVNQLGGRSAVENSCREYKPRKGEAVIFIVDGDFDFLLGRPEMNHKHLYRLPAYCAEGLLIHQGSVEKVAQLASPSAGMQEIRAKVQYAVWERENVKPLSRLFAVYAAAHAVDPAIPTVSLKTEGILLRSGKKTIVCKKKTFRRMMSIARVASDNVGRRAFLKSLREVKIRMRRLSVAEIVSGKDYLLPIVRIHIAAQANLLLSHEQLKVALAAGWPGFSDAKLTARLRRLANRVAAA